MPSLKVEHETKLSRTEAFSKVKDYLEHSKGLRNLDGDLKCQFDESSCSGKVKGSKFDCDVQITENPTKVVINVSFGLLFAPFKGKIQETLKKKMTDILG